MRVLVTGAQGRLGRRLPQQLESRGHDVVAVGSPRARGTGPRVDVTDRRAVLDLVAETSPDVVVHLASVAGASAEADPALTRAVNVDGAVHVADAAESSGTTRLVFASTAAVYGDAYASPASESSPLDPRSAYARSKVEAEASLRERSTERFHVVALRIFNIFGPGFDDSLIERLRRSEPGRPVRLRGPDDFVRDYSEVDSVTATLCAAVEWRGAPDFSVMNVGSGIPVSNRDLVERLSEEGEVHVALVDGPPSYSCADVELAKELLGHRPVGIL